MDAEMGMVSWTDAKGAMAQLVIGSGIAVWHFVREWKREKGEAVRHHNCRKYTQRVEDFDQLIGEMLNDVKHSQKHFQQEISTLADRVQW